MSSTLAALLFCLAAAPAAPSEILVGNKAASSLWRLSTVDGHRIAEHATEEGPHEIAVAKNGAFAVVANYGGKSNGSTLTVLDFKTNVAPRRIELGAHTRPHGMALFGDDKRLVVTTEGSDSLIIVDLAAGKVEGAIDVGAGRPHMVVVSPDGAIAYTTKIESGSVARVDLVRRVKLDEKPAGPGAEGIALRSNELWVTNRAANTVTVHDPSTLAVKQTIAADDFPIRVGFTPDGRYALVTCAKAAALAVYDAAAKRRVATVPLRENDVAYKDTMLGQAPLPIGLASTNERVFVAISGGDRLAVIDTKSWKVVTHFQTGREPDALGLR